MSTVSQNRPKKKKKWYEHKWWTALGVLATIAGLILAWLFSPYSPLRPSNADPNTSPTVASTGIESATATPAGTNSTPPLPPTPGPSVLPDASSRLFLSDVDDKRFINEPYRHFRGAASINGVPFPSSYHFKFENCTECSEETELNVPVGYQKLQGTVGLTDESRHDNVIDGIVYFSIYSTTGELLMEPQRIEYPETKSFDIVLKNSSRIRLVVSGGTNSEYPCWCNAQFTK
jgi:hypothetical protein